MKALTLLLLIAVAHVVFLLGAYGTGFFGLSKPLPHLLVVAIWLGASSALAGYAYFKASAKLHWFSSPALGVPFAFVAVAISLYVGVFLSFNIFGT